MIKFPELSTVFIQKKDCTRKVLNGVSVWVCPECKDHILSTDAVRGEDCKTIIYDDELSPDGKLQGGHIQCMCYSKEHDE